MTTVERAPGDFEVLPSSRGTVYADLSWSLRLAKLQTAPPPINQEAIVAGMRAAMCDEENFEARLAVFRNELEEEEKREAQAAAEAALKEPMELVEGAFEFKLVRRVPRRGDGIVGERLARPLVNDVHPPLTSEHAADRAARREALRAARVARDAERRALLTGVTDGAPLSGGPDATEAEVASGGRLLAAGSASGPPDGIVSPVGGAGAELRTGQSATATDVWPGSDASVTAGGVQAQLAARLRRLLGDAVADAAAPMP